jgi:hypothetical protein
MNRTALTGPALVANLARAGLFPHTVTFRERSTERDEYGDLAQLSDAESWTAVEGLEDIRAAVGFKEGKQRTDTDELSIVDEAPRAILDSYYPAVTVALAMEWNGELHEVTDVRHDQGHGLTEVRLSRARVT